MKKFLHRIAQRTRGRDTYNALKNSAYDALLPQTRLKPYLDSIGGAIGEAANNGKYTNRRKA